MGDLIGKVSKQGRMKEQQRINQDMIVVLKDRVNILEKALTESFEKIEKYMKENDERLAKLEGKKTVAKKPSVKKDVKEEVKDNE